MDPSQVALSPNRVNAGGHTAPLGGDALVAAFGVYLARLGDKRQFAVGFSDPSLRQGVNGLESYFAGHVPLRVELDTDPTLDAALRTVRGQLEVVRRHGTYLLDLIARSPEIDRGAPTLPIAVELVEPHALANYTLPPAAELALAIAADGSATRWLHDAAVYSADSVATMERQFANFQRVAAEDGDRRLSEVSLLTEVERHRVLVEWNDTARETPADACIHDLFEAQADRTPDTVAVVFEAESITYRELDRRANQIARHLRDLGVGPDVLVGMCMERSIDLVAGLLGIHKAGGAYVPLDPTYPQERLDYMVEDSRLQVLVTQHSLVGTLNAGPAAVVCLDTDAEAIAAQSDERLVALSEPHHLAYVIYTSGSTGKPKGVMVEHRNALNFFVGMDDRLDRPTEADPRQRVWLAVTSLSFDISVLELFWTLTRGFKVVLHADQNKLATAEASTNEPATAVVSKPIQFSLFYFSSDESEAPRDKYQLLMEGAKFADTHDFAAVWTPERHFHAFGGLYPNPAVTSAALAAITSKVQIRAGSVVLPLHSPIRVAEEWSLVDNLSGGRVGISFAAGWQPNDFALAPEAFADRKEQMYRHIETVQRLWRGEDVAFPGPKGKDISVRTLPRPVQPELPIWITAAGTPETYERAGRIGAGLLTHLLGQSTDELAQKLELYRRAWREAGHPGNGHVTLMLHTFVGDDEAAVHEIVREPMKEYLRSSVDLIRQAAWSFPTFAQQAEATGQSAGEIFDSERTRLTDQEMDALLDHAFERYYRTSGLFGTPRSCLSLVQKLKAIDIDEIACLVDFGIDMQTVLSSLPRLNALRELSNPTSVTIPESHRADFSIGAQMDSHGVTHLQCTPSMAGMLLLDDRARASLPRLANMMVGGEAFPVTLARQLRELVAGDVINMYGPTETTIWSSTHRIAGVDGSSIPIGRPIANTQLYILDAARQPQPIGVPGELFIGGLGVVRGYLDRPELTAERFVNDPFSSDPTARMYRTGDLARFLSDGTVEFLGRMDHQVKIRGHRIELGEIETLLNEHPSIREAVVIAREDVPGDKRLVGYVIARPNQSLAGSELKAHLRTKLPEYMIPSHIVALEAFPLTPNAKVDRKALPAPEGRELTADTQAAFVAAEGDLEGTLASIWSELLNMPEVSVTDNFFELGGHSLLMVQVHHKLRTVLDRELTITDLFRYPTIRSLTEHLSRDPENAAVELQQSGEDRASTRRELMARRRQLLRSGSER